MSPRALVVSVLLAAAAAAAWNAARPSGPPKDAPVDEGPTSAIPPRQVEGLAGRGRPPSQGPAASSLGARVAAGRPGGGDLVPFVVRAYPDGGALPTTRLLSMGDVFVADPSGRVAVPAALAPWVRAEDDALAVLEVDRGANPPTVHVASVRVVRGRVRSRTSPGGVAASVESGFTLPPGEGRVRAFRAVIADADGRFELEAPVGDGVFLRVVADELEPAVVAAPTADGIDVVLDEDPWLTGRLASRDGKPLVGVTVRAEAVSRWADDPARSWAWSAREGARTRSEEDGTLVGSAYARAATDADGRYALRVPRSDEVALDVEGECEWAALDLGPVSASRVTDFVLRSGAELVAYRFRVGGTPTPMLVQVLHTVRRPSIEVPTDATGTLRLGAWVPGRPAYVTFRWLVAGREGQRSTLHARAVSWTPTEDPDVDVDRLPDAPAGLPW